MRHVWGLASAVGLLVAVAFGMWACLTASAGESSATPSALIAIGGILLAGIGIAARGDGSLIIAKARRAVAAAGLVVAPVSGLLALLSLATDPRAAAGFLVLTALALGAWAQGVSTQVGLSIRMSFVWLATLALCVAAALVLGSIIAAVVAGAVSLGAGGLGLDPEVATRTGFAVAVATFVFVFAVWARGRPDRAALPKALGRTALGRTAPGDLALLSAGPAPVLRRRPTATGDHAAADARLAAADAHLTATDGGTSDGTTSTEC